MIHAIEKHRRDEQILKEQDRDIQGKVAQLQLGEVTNKNKIQASVVEVPPRVEVPVIASVLVSSLPPATPVQPPVSTEHGGGSSHLHGTFKAAGGVGGMDTLNSTVQSILGHLPIGSM